MKTRIYSVLSICRMRWATLFTGLAAILLTQAVVAQEKSSGETDKTKEFYFSGSRSPDRFISAVQKHFRLDWGRIVTVPASLSFSIPAMRLETSDPMDVIKLYNRLAEENPDMGKWVVEGSVTKPSAVVLVPDRSRLAKGPVIKMKAFPLRGIPREEWKKLISRAHGIGLRMSELSGTSDLHPDVDVVDDVEILVVQGSEEFVEFMDSFLTAYRDNLQIGTGGGIKIDGGNSGESKDVIQPTRK